MSKKGKLKRFAKQKAIERHELQEEFLKKKEQEELIQAYNEYAEDQEQAIILNQIDRNYNP